ncbi:CBL-interacting protein kinase 2-like [Andrographis paniculata]|uniref:CBL-interacting protein kinase 2-like n=1 Tax=Andrographis paniculata TaxID=175694 RepID=UPI0021E94F02|nr:CBL-interacting protein kinase 2-like [Andrographis paniculata]XP_051122913.1 CBL-interacting protein kinase 2-like [Andrographis paniculata]
MDTKGNILMGKYEIGRFLGQGAFAKVYYGKHIETEQAVAIKAIDKARVAKLGLMNQIEREISVMRLIKHQNITQIYEVMATKAKIYFVIEYAKGGELFRKVAKKRLKEGTVRKYFQQLIFAVNFCHKRGVYHRDLKPENLLLDEHGCLKVSDFGLSALSESQGQDGLLHTACGTPAYTAPEIVTRKGYDGAKADIWSCGVVLFVLFAGYLPFYDQNVMEMYRKIFRAEYTCPEWCSPQVSRLLSRMLDPNPKTRVSIDGIMATPWFRKGLDSKLVKGKAGDIDADAGTDIVKHFGFEDLAAMSKPVTLNAFGIISLSSGLDLSGLLVNTDQKDEAKFTSDKSASTIISKFEEIAGNMKLKVTEKNDKGSLKLEHQKDSWSGSLTIYIEISEITSSFHFVEMMSRGDGLYFQKILKQDMKPALGDIVWDWQGDQKVIELSRDILA